ncbi:SDR family oxidoreductase [Nocardioides sp. W7]|uniref:SDR family NAD(P)-dependent oxidoreductase n=1 Tax=Nocardioides sp. W7 TaxID=2931390 RepID=UPI001FD08D9E|nr:SDR family oxidoreductase [Nocardioides sp. W7]
MTGQPGRGRPLDPTTQDRVDLGFTRGDTLLVTGAASGIGRAVALNAARMGLRVSAWDLQAGPLATLAEEIGATGGEVMTVVGDVSDEATVRDGFAELAGRFGPARYLANNAGPPSSVPLEFDEAVRISVGSVRRMTETWAATGLPEGAAMVATTSVAGNLVGTESDWYSASKAAVMGYVRHLAAHRAGEFRSNGVAPGMTDTPRLAGYADSEAGQHILGRIPLRRMGSADDMALAILFLLSPLAAYVNGVLLPVDGGWTVTQ